MAHKKGRSSDTIRKGVTVERRAAEQAGRVLKAVRKAGEAGAFQRDIQEATGFNTIEMWDALGLLMLKFKVVPKAKANGKGRHKSINVKWVALDDPPSRRTANEVVNKAERQKARKSGKKVEKKKGRLTKEEVMEKYKYMRERNMKDESDPGGFE